MNFGAQERLGITDEVGSKEKEKCLSFIVWSQEEIS